MRPHGLFVLAGAACAALLAPGRASADHERPPWTSPGDLPIADWMRSIQAQRPETAIFSVPGKLDTRRGTMTAGARLPLYGAKRGPNCRGRWLLVGPLAWVCSDGVEATPDPAWPARAPANGATAAWAGDGDGLPFRYYAVRSEGAFGFENLTNALDDAPSQEFDPGFIVGAVEERTRHGERWVRTAHDRWIALRDLAPMKPSLFRGEVLEGERASIDFAWVVSQSASTRRGPRPNDAVAGTRVRHQLVPWREERATSAGKKPGAPVMVRVSEDGAPEEWMSSRDLARPSVAPRPDGVAQGERWIDVELATQTLVAYEGDRPAFATLVSTGRGPAQSDTATPKGTHRIWVKLTATNMDNLEREDVERRYSIEDVPYVQFFDRAIALHAAFWHKDYGRVRSHGCVNLAPKDAAWLFDFTGPRLPSGWSAVLPTVLEPGTAVRVR